MHVVPLAKPSTPALPWTSPVTMAAVCHLAMCATTPMTVTTTVMKATVPFPHAILRLSSPVPMDVASVQTLSVMATTTAEIMPPPMKSTAVS